MISEIQPKNLLIARFGLKFLSGYGCNFSALVNGALIMMQKESNEPVPRFYWLESLHHACLIFNQIVLSDGVTAPPGYFDFISFSEATLGDDQTADNVRLMIHSLHGGRFGLPKLARATESRFSHEQIPEVLTALQQWLDGLKLPHSR